MSDESPKMFDNSISSLISDYRLTLTDLYELNLIDQKNGLIINPLNGDRLTISDAIRINLINPNIKEIFNIFKESRDKNQILSISKVSINEAISLSILDPFNNIIHLSSTDPDLKVNIYQAAKYSLILKPLSLSEAFMKNLIRSDGFVQNPFDQKFYEFKDLVNEAIRDKSIQKCYFFDLDLKHISICFNSNQKLFSIRETIEQGFILPYSFQINSKCIEKCNGDKVNIYEALFTKILKSKFYLLLFKPFVQNTSIVVDKNECNSREKIGLNEAINLKLVNLNNQTYFLPLSKRSITLDQAVFKYKIIERQLLDILKFPIKAYQDKKNCSIIDCINDFSLILDRQVCKNPLNEELISFSSDFCQSVMGKEVVENFKKLCPKIVIKTYVLFFNNHRKQFDTKFHKMSQEENLSYCVDYKLKNLTPTQELNKELLKNWSLNQLINDSLVSFLNHNKDLKTVCFEKILAVHSIQDTKNGNFYSIDQSIKRGILNINKFLIKNSKTAQELTLIDAFNKGFLKGHFVENHKSYNNQMMKQNRGKLIFKKELDQNIILIELEEKYFKIKAFFDPKRKCFLSIKQAVIEGIFDETTGTYTNPLAKTKMNLNQASAEGLVLVDSKECLKLNDESCNSILVIDIMNRKEGNSKINSFYYSRVNCDKTLLYEITELEEIKYEKPVDEIGPLSDELNESKLPRGYFNCFQHFFKNKLSISDRKNISIITIDDSILSKNKLNLNISCNKINSYFIKKCDIQSVRIFKI